MDPLELQAAFAPGFAADALLDVSWERAHGLRKRVAYLAAVIREEGWNARAEVQLAFEHLTNPNNRRRRLVRHHPLSYRSAIALNRGHFTDKYGGWEPLRRKQPNRTDWPGNEQRMDDDLSANASKDDIKRLLEETHVVKNACRLDLLLFLRRHPRTLLTNEQLAAMVGYEMKEIAASIDAFVEAGFVQRTQNPIHAARLYLLTAEGPRERALKVLLDIASTRPGRQTILQALSSKTDHYTSNDHLQRRRKLHAIG